MNLFLDKINIKHNHIGSGNFAPLVARPLSVLQKNMKEIEKQFRDKVKRSAIRMQIGGFRPSQSPKASCFGKVNFCIPGEPWPKVNGKSMWPLCQLNITEFPFRPPRLDDIEFITVFIGPEQLPNHKENGEGWCLRAYRNIKDLVPISGDKIDSPIKSFEMKPEVLEEDYPCWDDADSCPEELENDYFDLFANHSGFKIGGWPTLIQSEIFWAPLNKHPFNPDYVFQIDSTEKGNWSWGDGGVGYFGRGTTSEGKDSWALSWQCY